ncbi:unnamed protein product [Microthlaspi erraticum]|uniref:Arabidopsis retrotransposon Orf1 C-terminal domain-containing protein n=1 Tax=Microthlaspi erraticum TaxID=1685480 RepID=A0A6D2HZS9_9BRAS|nr:unnamed protein product [Microthlaspi erraticum]
MVEGEIKQCKKRRLKMQADLKDDQRMEDLMQRYVYSEEEEESDGLQVEDGEDNQDEQMEDAEESKRRMSSPCTKSTTMLSSPWTLWRPSTHMMTHEALGIFEDVELVLKNMHLAKFFSHRMESYKELTCEFLASMRYHMSKELDRADWTKAGMDHVLGKGREEMVTFRQLGDTVWVHYGEESGTSRKELQRVWATIAEGVLFLKESHGTINEEKEAPYHGNQAHHLTHKDGRGSEEIEHTQGTHPLPALSLTAPLLQDTAYNTRHQRGRSLVLEGHHTYLCAAGVKQEKVYSRLDGHQVLQDQPPH